MPTKWISAVAVLFAALCIFVAPEAFAACGCAGYTNPGDVGTVTADGTSNCLIATAPAVDWEGNAAQGQDITLRLDSGTWDCSQDVTGNWIFDAGATVTSIEPDHTAQCYTAYGDGDCLNGYEINPTHAYSYNFDSRINYANHEQTPYWAPVQAGKQFPYNPSHGDVILKSDSRTSCTAYPNCTAWHAIFIAADPVPTVASFRPPVPGTSNKVFRAESTVDMDRLADLPAPASTPTAASVLQGVNYYPLFWPGGFWDLQYVGTDAAHRYPQSWGGPYLTALLFIQTDASDAEKKPIYYRLINLGNDIEAHLNQSSNTYGGTSGGTLHNRFVWPILAAGAFDEAAFGARVTTHMGNQNNFAETYSLTESATLTYSYDDFGLAQNVFFGEPKSQYWSQTFYEEEYWACLAWGAPGGPYYTGVQECSLPNGFQVKDPYGEIDGAYPNSAYQNQTFAHSQYEASTYRFFPDVRQYWASDYGDLLLKYVERMKDYGMLFDGDQCATPAATGYGSTWGRNGLGACIEDGVGRLQSEDGNAAVSNTYSTFGQDMIGTYWGCAIDCSCSGMTGLCGVGGVDPPDLLQGVDSSGVRWNN